MRRCVRPAARAVEGYSRGSANATGTATGTGTGKVIKRLKIGANTCRQWESDHMTDGGLLRCRAGRRIRARRGSRGHSCHAVVRRGGGEFQRNLRCVARRARGRRMRTCTLTSSSSWSPEGPAGRWVTRHTSRARKKLRIINDCMMDTIRLYDCTTCIS